ncbi:MAG: hypothetical protein GTO18_01425 [Anaerolineales bacterium]|nr:hypothetical protein [Anaerolineales bacterium]
MTLPSFVFGWLIATVCGLLFHFIRGGSLSRLILYLFTAWGSFFIGHFVAEWLDWHLLRMGTINLFPALLSTILGLVAASVLVGPEYKRPKQEK